MSKLVDAILRLGIAAVALVLVTFPGGAEAANPCLTPDIKTNDLEVKTLCSVPGGVTLPRYRYVNITAGGTLQFEDGGDTHIWASAIIVENGGTLRAGTPQTPIGTTPGSKVTIHLWGPATPKGAKGVPCKSVPVETCGAPANIFFANNVGNDGHTPKPKDQVKKVSDLGVDLTSYKGPRDDYFYGYHNLHHDEGDMHAYFGTKVLGVGYGGILELFGKKGVCTGARCEEPRYTGRSWVRLKGTADAGAQSLTVETPEGGLGWEAGDQIVITTTDYLPGHSEQLTIKGAPTDNGNGTTTIALEQALKYVHHGERYPLPNDARIQKLGLSTDLTTQGAELRASVGLLSRSIRIVSAGATKDDPANAALGSPFPAENSPECTSGKGPETSECYFGGHVVVRQAFAKVQIQGVEFFQLGQGGRIGRYPVHFHHARKTQDAAVSLPPTFVKDSSVWDSMTRWIVLHGTQDVTLQRNVGYKSIGHGFYLEDGTEINNRLIANLGVLARGAVEQVEVDRQNKYLPAAAQPDNPRRIPGILVASNSKDEKVKDIPWRTDADNPTLFWIMNGWNDFQYNMAAGANVCGACYWLVPGWNSTVSKGLKWESYASMQDTADRAGMTPLKSFIGNVCTSTQIAFNTVGNLEECQGVGDPQVVSTNPLNRVVDANQTRPYFKAIENPLAHERPFEDFTPAVDPLTYFPSVNTGGFRKATLGDVDAAGKALGFCTGADCSSKPDICSAGHEDACTFTTLDGFVSSFTAAPYNFAALWLRNQWYLVQNSVITDVQNGGLNFVTGGGYTASDRIPGLWQLVYKSVFIGQSQPEAHFYARNGGPFNPDAYAASGLQCAYRFGPNNDPNLSGSFCLDLKEGVAFQLSNFGMGQRLFSLYDGPAVQDSNAYVGIPIRKIDDCSPTPGLINVDCPLDQRDAVCSINCKTVKINEVDHQQCQKSEQVAGSCSRSTAWTDANQIRHTESHWIAGSIQGLPKGEFKVDNDNVQQCYMPNAAIAWKQPNGFYYPPAFRSRNLYFGQDVAIRHFVVEPLFQEGTLKTDLERAKALYCKFDQNLFTGFTSNDRQTVLLDEDGSLTGYTSSFVSTPPSPLDKTTTVVNLDELLASPVEAVECLSDGTSRTTPYQYVTTVLYPSADDGIARQEWSQPCTNEVCYGVPIFRQDVLPKQDTVQSVLQARSLRMMGQSTFQRSSITVNNGTYYINTAVSSAEQAKSAADRNVFQAGGVYYLFTLYAKPHTRQIYQIYVGKNATFSPQSQSDLWLTQADIAPNPVAFGSKLRALAANEASYNPSSGILTVTLDHAKFTPSFTEVTKANCGPKTYCQMSGDKCVDASGSDAICRWGAIDLDCPDGGCYGIGFKLPGSFLADDGDHRPVTTAVANCIDKTKRPEWNVSLVTASDGTCPAAGQPLTDDFCGSADEVSIAESDPAERVME